MSLKILFITRNYPPLIGGLETYSYNLIQTFEKQQETYKITLGKCKAHLLWFIPFSFFKALSLIIKHRITHIHLCDGMLAPIGFLLKLLTRASVSSTIVGLDITYPNFLYQRIIPRCVSRMDKIICISRATRSQCLARGISPHKCAVIPIGITPGDVCISGTRDAARNHLEPLVGTSLAGKKILVTVGRLIKRKGVAWFVDQVMPRLDRKFHYLIVGDGPEQSNIAELILDHGLKNRISMLGRISDQEKKFVLNGSDIFIMPNITVPGDIEGFGIVALEAGACGLPVVASNIEGMQDSIIHEKTGYLVEEQNVEAFMDRIQIMKLTPPVIRDTVYNTFGWPQIYTRYRDVLFSTNCDCMEEAKS